MLILSVLIAVGFYLVSIFRDYAGDDRQTPVDALANLREMHRKGDISDEEFRNIESKTHQRPVGLQASDDSTSQAESSSNPNGN